MGPAEELATYTNRVPPGEMRTLLGVGVSKGTSETSDPRSTSSRVNGRSTGRSALRHGAQNASAATSARPPATTQPRFGGRAGVVADLEGSSSNFHASPTSRRRFFRSFSRQLL